MTSNHRPARRALGLAAAVVLLASCGAESGNDADGVIGVSGATGDLVTTLSERGLASAASALENIDLNELANSDDYTFLAPNDDAFLALSADEAAEVMASDETLGSVLSNHLIEGRLDLDELDGVESITAISGMELAIGSTPEGATIGGALVTETDIEPGGRMLHIVDKIFVP